MNQLEQLKREGNLLAKPVRPKKPKGAFRPMSKKREKENKEYLRLRKEFLRAHPLDMAWSRIHGWTLDNGGRSFDRERSTEIHHMRKPRSTYLLDTSTWLAVSRKSHEWIESNKSIARKLGLLQ